MKILILGGTVFLGRHLAAAALARGHQLTLFNRGRSHPWVRETSFGSSYETGWDPAREAELLAAFAGRR